MAGAERNEDEELDSWLTVFGVEDRQERARFALSANPVALLQRTEKN
jgi:hypothetical protein